MVFIFHRIRIDNALKTLTDDYNQKIHTAFKDAGIPYIPFILTYSHFHSKTNFGFRKPVKTVKIDVDTDFLKSYFARKVSFEQWLSKNHLKAAREHYRYLDKQQPTDHYHIKELRKQFNREVPLKDQKQTFKKQSAIVDKGIDHFRQVSGHVVGHVKENSQSGDDRWTGYTGADVDKFIENEDFMFSGNIRMFLQSQDTDGKIRKILKDVLGEFKTAFLNMDLTEIAFQGAEEEEDPKEAATFQEYLAKKRAQEGRVPVSRTRSGVAGLYQPNKKWLGTLTGEKQTWNQSQPVKFPSIPNILDWFKRTGMYRSIKYEEFVNAKTVKQRQNWIDRSVFLLANGVYAKLLGQDTRFASGNKRRPPFLKHKQSAGAKIPLSKARKYNKPSKDREKYQTERQLGLAAIRVDMRKFAAGWRNSKNVYSRVNRKRGNTSRYDKRKDNRGAV